MQECELSPGTGIIRSIAATPMTSLQMLCEWIDNSFGAGARTVTIIQEAGALTIVDDGAGCADLKKMETIAVSVPQKGNRAQMYGVGGVNAQIVASRIGPVRVDSVTRDFVGAIEIDWHECLHNNSFTANHDSQANVDGRAPGTVIRIGNTRPIKRSRDLFDELGWRYAAVLRRGRRIVLQLRGEEHVVAPYRHPKFSAAARVELDFTFDGCRIRGFCGLVAAGVKNPYWGVSCHWGYRVLERVKSLPCGRSLLRIYGEIQLPQNWRHVTLTKDAVLDGDERDQLLEQIAQRCSAVLDLADDQAEDFELCETTLLAEQFINGELAAVAERGAGGIKGRRPGKSGAEGTVEPTGCGGLHQRFTTSQPGDKALGDLLRRPRAPLTIRLRWNPDMAEDQAYEFVATSRGLSLLWLNGRLAEFYRSDHKALASYVVPIVAREIVDGVAASRGLFPSFRTSDYQKTLMRLSRHVVGRPELAGAEKGAV